MDNQTHDFEKFLKSLGHVLGEIRKDKDLTQTELGIRTKKGQSAIGKIERGPVPNIPLRMIYEVAYALPIPLSELFAFTERHVGDASTHKQKGHWLQIVERVNKLSPQKQEWIAKIVQDVLEPSTTDNLRQRD